MTPDYIPAQDADYANWAANFASLITADPTRYGVEIADAATIQTASDDWVAAYNLATDPTTRTPPNVAAKDAQRITSEGIHRPFAMQINANPAVTDPDRVALGLTVRKTDRTPIPAPASAPALELRAGLVGLAELAYSDTGAPEGKAKPSGAIGVEVWEAVGDVPATDPAESDFKFIATKSPFDFPNKAADRGKLVTVFARFSNRSGPGGVAATGPWSAPLTFTVT